LRRERNLSLRVTGLLGRRIVAGVLQPGGPVPTEASLCVEYGVSRTTVREAMKRLHAKGLVEGGPRCGSHVLPTEAWNQLDPDVLAWRVEAGAEAGLLGQLYDMRDCFEPRACRLAAEHGNAEDLAAIHDRFAAFAATGDDPAGQAEADVALHLAIFAATGNPFLVAMGSAIRTALLLSFHRHAAVGGGMPAEAVQGHGAVCAAIAARDGELAEAAMRALLATSRRVLNVAATAMSPAA
jgi:DNA-binding FadR family transcriptional regulator